jgi:hypothetical protein
MVLLFSGWFSFSRKIMPDTFSVSLVIMGLYLGHAFLLKGGWWRVASSAVLLALGILSKIPALSLMALAPLALLMWRGHPKRVAFLLAAQSVAIIPALWWYFHWVPHLVSTYGYPLYFPKTMAEGFAEIVPLYWRLLDRFEFSALQSHMAFLCFLAGLYFAFRQRMKWPLIGFAMVSAVFAVFIVKTGAVFPLHNYYIVPYTPMMAVVAGIGLSRLNGRWLTLVMAVIVVESFINQYHDFRTRPQEMYRLRLETLMDAHVPKDALIAINGGPSPRDIYYANRKGWSLADDAWPDITEIRKLREMGAGYLVMDLGNVPFNASPPGEVVHQDGNYLIVRITDG